MLPIKKRNYIFCFLSFVFGIFIGGFVISKGYLKGNFFECSFIELLKLFLMTFLGMYVAFWTRIKTDSMQKRKDLCLSLIEEAHKLFTDQKKLVSIYFEDASYSGQGKLILSGFRTITNKIEAITKIANAIDNTLSIGYLENTFQVLKSQFGDNYGSNDHFPSEKINLIMNQFNKFDKLFDDLRIKILL